MFKKFQIYSRSPCSTMWVGCQSRRFLCLFWRETRQRILGPEISPYPEVVRGRERELTTRPGGEAVCGGTAKRVSVEPRTGAVNTGLRRPVADKMGSSEEDESRWRYSSCFVEFLLVTHASDSLHMHVVLHNSFCSLLTPSVLFVFVRLFYFLLSPRSYSCVAVKKCALPPQPLVDHRPAVRSGMVRRLR